MVYQIVTVTLNIPGYPRQRSDAVWCGACALESAASIAAILPFDLPSESVMLSFVDTKHHRFCEDCGNPLHVKPA
jgi:hypothetical protein